MKPVPCPCDGRICLLSFIYPGTDAILACDSKCHIASDPKGDEYFEFYMNMFPERYQNYLNAIEKQKKQ